MTRVKTMAKRRKLKWTIRRGEDYDLQHLLCSSKRNFLIKFHPNAKQNTLQVRTYTTALIWQLLACSASYIYLLIWLTLQTCFFVSVFRLTLIRYVASMCFFTLCGCLRIIPKNLIFIHVCITMTWQKLTMIWLPKGSLKLCLSHLVMMASTIFSTWYFLISRGLLFRIKIKKVD